MSTEALEIFGSYWRRSEPWAEFRAELDQMETVVIADNGGSWEWDEYHVYWHTGRKRFYVIDGSGCSCDGISDDVYSLGDFQEFGDRESVLRDFKSSRDYWPQWLRDAVLVKIRDFKEAV